MTKKRRRFLWSDHFLKNADAKGANRHGGEGNVFQVNDPPQRPVERSPNQGHDAEGKAFQVNDQPAEKEKP